jgi:hypothetical protein
MLIFYDPAGKIEKFEKVCPKEYDSFSNVSAVNRNIDLLYEKARTNKKSKPKARENKKSLIMKCPEFKKT